MAIRLDIQEYCADCFDFDPDVIKPERAIIFGNGDETIVRHSDTIVRCTYAKRCEAIKRYLSQLKESK